MIKVSVIVPAYNSEKYINKCLDSLVNQTLKEIEIVVINDGSTDKTSAILNSYLTKYPLKIKVINQENQGIAEARNRGIELASGRTIAFLDSDDFVDLEMYEKLYNKMESMDYDIVSSTFYYHYDDHDDMGIKDLNGDILTFKDLKKYFLKLYPVIWNKLYKQELVKGIKFKNVYAEDVEFLYSILPKVKKVGFVPEPLYYYYQREKSESKVFTEKLFDYIYNFNSLYQDYQKNDYFKHFLKEFEFVYVRYLYATFLKRSATLDKELRENAYKVAKKNVKEKFPHYRRNKYFYQSLKGLYLVTFNKIYFKIMCIGGKK